MNQKPKITSINLSCYPESIWDKNWYFWYLIVPADYCVHANFTEDCFLLYGSIGTEFVEKCIQSSRDVWTEMLPESENWIGILSNCWTRVRYKRATVHFFWLVSTKHWEWWWSDWFVSVVIVKKFIHLFCWRLEHLHVNMLCTYSI